MSRRRKSNPIDWASIRLDYEATLTSVRGLGRQHRVSYEAIRHHIAEENWQRPAVEGEPEGRQAIVGDVMALSRSIAARLLTDLDHRQAGVEEIDRAAATLKNLAVAARAFGDAQAPRAEAADPTEPATAAPGKKELQRDAAAKIGKSGRYATPPTPPHLVVNNAS